MKKGLKLSERITESIAIGTIFLGTVTTVLMSSSSSLMGLTLVAVGVVTYAAVRVFNTMGYEKTSHISPIIKHTKEPVTEYSVKDITGLETPLRKQKSAI